MGILFKNIHLINRYGTRGIVRDLLLIVINSAVLFLAAETIRWFNAWIYISLVSVHQITITLLLLLINPKLLNERGKTIKEGTIFFDRIFVIIYPFLTLILSFIAGIDAVRFEWSNIPSILIIPGVILFIFSSLLGSWAIIVNKHFEATIRVQKDRHHKVCKSGPYKHIRHPGYSAWIIGAFGYPLILGSLVSFIPVIILIVLFILRTIIEDKTLQQELDGYKEYMKKTKYRLIPYVW